MAPGRQVRALAWMLGGFSAWTLSYHLVLAARLPAWTVIPFASLALPLVWAGLVRQTGSGSQSSRVGSSWTAGVLLASLANGVDSLVVPHESRATLRAMLPVGDGPGFHEAAAGGGLALWVRPLADGQ